MKIFFVYNIFTFILILCLTDDLSYVKFPIYTNHTPYPRPNETIKMPYYNYFYYNSIYTMLEIGNPSQKIVAKLNMDEYPFYIYYNRCTIMSNFDLNVSKTYKRTPFQYLLTDIYVFTSLVDDFVHISDKDYYVKYLFSPVNNGTAEQKIEKLPYTCAEIGLKIPKPDMKSFNYSFIRNLKLSNAIKTYNFFIEYNEENDDEGEIIIGIEPHNYNKKKYKEDKLVELYSEQFNYDLYWQLKFNEIYYNTNKNNQIEKEKIEILDVGFNHNINIMIAPVEYMYLIEADFFKKNNCTRNILEKNFYNYHCNSLEDIKAFPTIYLNHRSLGHTFEITYKDAFREYNGQYRCLLWFDMSYRHNWVMGKPFLKKYFFSYNVDKKNIAFYGIINKEGEEEESGNDKSENVQKMEIVYITVIVILLIIIGVLSFLVAKNYYHNKKNNKKKAYFMEDSTDMPIDDGKE